MRIVTTNTGHHISTGKKCVIVQHEQEEAVFVTVKLNVPEIRPDNLKLLSPVDALKKDFGLISDVINGYFASLPDSRQKAIFAIYKDLEELMEVSGASQDIFGTIREYVTDLYKLMPYSEIEHYVLEVAPTVGLTIKLPVLKTQYDIDSPDNTRTYLKADYIDLMIFSIALKPMLPIWGQYIENIASEVGTVYKEDRAAGLIDHTELIDTRAYQRYNSYVHAYVNHSGNDIGLAAVLGNMSSIGYPSYLLNLSMVRKLTTSKLPLEGSPLEAANLIRECYSGIKNKVEHPESVFRENGYIRDKMPDYSDKEDDNSSVLERFKMRETLDKATVLGIYAMIDEPHRTLSRFDHTASHEALDESIAWIKANPHVLESPALTFLLQHTLCGLQIHRPTKELRQLLIQINPELIQYGEESGLVKTITFSTAMVQLLDLPRLINIAAIAQTVLAHKGFFNLAALITSSAETTPGSRLMGSNFDPIDPKMAEVAIATYTHLHLSTTDRAAMDELQKESLRSVEGRTRYQLKLMAKNPLISTAHKTVQLWNKYSWNPAGPNYVLDKAYFRTQRNEAQNKVLPPSIKNELFKMVLKTKAITEW